MRQSDWETMVESAMRPALEYLESLDSRPVYKPTEPGEIRTLLETDLPDTGTDPAQVISELAATLEPYVAAYASGRYFGFVMGGLHPAAYGAELLASTWDQNAVLYAASQASVATEEIAANWLVELLGLPDHASVGFVTGGQMANATCLAAARHHVLERAGWNVERDGLQGAPHINLIVKEDQHSSVSRALRFLGLGRGTALRIGCDSESRIDLRELADALRIVEGPTILCLEAGNVDTGSFDPFTDVAAILQQHRDRGNPAWVHVDGAVGLWAAATSGHQDLTAGLTRCDSWSTDGHKLLNVAYDSGMAITAHPQAHRAAMGTRASYLIHSDGGVRDPLDYNPEFSRRARGLGVYATLRSLGRQGVDRLVEQTCAMAARFAERIADHAHAEIINEVVFNQVLVRWRSPLIDDNTFTDALLEAIRSDGTAYFTGTTRNGQRLMRISVSDWATDERDVERSVEAIMRCVAQVNTAAAP